MNHDSDARGSGIGLEGTQEIRRQHECCSLGYLACFLLSSGQVVGLVLGTFPISVLKCLLKKQYCLLVTIVSYLLCFFPAHG